MKPLDDPHTSLPFIHETLSTLRQEITPDTTLLGFVGTPWTLAAYAMEGKAERHCINTKVRLRLGSGAARLPCLRRAPQLRAWCKGVFTNNEQMRIERTGTRRCRSYVFSKPMQPHAVQKIMMNDPAILHAMLDNLTAALTRYVCYQIDAGAQVVQLFDSWAHHLSPEQFQEFSLPYAQRVIDGVRAVHPTVPLIFHANGGVGKLDAMAACSADVLGLDWNTDMAEARAAYPSRVTQGNVDPMVLFGTEECIRQSVSACLKAAGPQHHILNVGHGVVQGTPEENVKLFVQLARESAATPALAAV